MRVERSEEEQVAHIVKLHHDLPQWHIIDLLSLRLAVDAELHRRLELGQRLTVEPIK